MSKNVFLIGSGGRIRNSFIPSFKCLQNKYVLSGLYSPTQANREAVCEKWNIPAFDSLASVDFSKIDVIVISILTHHVPSVLAQISDACKGKVLVVDTPVFASIKDFKAIRDLRKFSKVVVAEDYMNYPQFGIMRDILRAGLLGDIREVTLAHTGYRYHALALLRSFVGLEEVRSIKRSHSEQGMGRTTLNFKRGVSAVILEPYQRLDGWVAVDGTKASLIYDPGKKYKGDSEKPTFMLNEHHNEHGEAVFALEGASFNEIRQPKYFAELKKMDIEDSSDFNTFKSCGLIDVIESIDHENDASRYSWRQALYDSALSKCIWRMRNMPGALGRIIPVVCRLASGRLS